MFSHSWYRGIGPEPELSCLLLFLVLLLQVGKGVALGKAGEKTSTLPPLFCSENFLNPRVLLMSTKFQDLCPKDFNFLSGGNQEIKAVGQA